jgi:hypothetical protein
MDSESPLSPDAPGAPLERAAPDTSQASSPPASRPRVDEGRLGIYAAMGAGTGTVPLPWVPEALARRVRGSLVYDVAVRHGVTLDPAAREALAARAPGEKRGLVRQAVRFVGSTLAKRALTGLGPFGLVGPVRAALDTYVLGHLFDRYLARRAHTGKPSPSRSAGTTHNPRIEENEARRIRTAIDGALLRALTVDVDPVAPPPRGADDGRDETTAFIDGVLSFAAGVPEQLIVRLDAAFDDIMQYELG